MTTPPRGTEHYPEGVSTTVSIPDFTMEQMLVEAIADFPKRVAIDFLGREWTYEEIGADVQRAITVLKMCGVREGDVVSVIQPNCPQHFTAFYAIIALGATVAEHNPLAPVAQLNREIDLVGSKVVIAWEQTIEKCLPTAISADGLTYQSILLNLYLPNRSYC